MVNWRLPLLVATFWLVLAFSGIIYGWTDMQLVMEREGVYCIDNCGTSRATFDEVKYTLVVTIGEVSSSWCMCAASDHPSACTRTLVRTRQHNYPLAWAIRCGKGVAEPTGAP